MVDATRKASAEETAENKLQYHQFLFLYSNAMLHESTYVYITYLWLGRSHTSDDINEGKLDRIIFGIVAKAGG